MTGFIASLVGSNRREDAFLFFFQIINIFITCLRLKRIQTSIIKTFNNGKGCRDDKQKKRKNIVGMSGKRTPSR